MSLSKNYREQILRDILRQISDNKLNINGTAKKYNISNQSLYRYLRELTTQGIIEKSDEQKYLLASEIISKSYVNVGLAEEIIWRQDIAPFCSDIPETHYDKINYIFAEIMNNAIEHSESEEIDVIVAKTHLYITIAIVDNGIGIFQKIQSAFNLPEKSFAILELSKGKLTTAPETHTGQGIFFSSRIADIFVISSDEIVFTSKSFYETEDTLYTSTPKISQGTYVFFVIHFDNETRIQEVLQKYSTHSENRDFNATNVPVRLLDYGIDNPVLVSRSEARRLLTRFERFNKITLDFTGIRDMRQGFADEVFRVFVNKHPDCTIKTINCNDDVRAMIEHVKRTL
jgi:anti-sigma regulatory factor (Ser/Thr protein kinase)